jgi:hypothetical protein
MPLLEYVWPRVGLVPNLSVHECVGCVDLVFAAMAVEVSRNKECVHMRGHGDLPSFYTYDCVMLQVAGVCIADVAATARGLGAVC